jgi:hypothetical protein
MPIDKLDELDPIERLEYRFWCNETQSKATPTAGVRKPPALGRMHFLRVSLRQKRSQP